MTLEEKLAICKTCENRRVDYEKGVVCSLTDEKPAFEDSCPDFVPATKSSSAYNKLNSKISFKSGNKYRPNLQRSKWVIISLGLVLFFDIVNGIAMSMENSLYNDVLEGHIASDSRIAVVDFFLLAGGIGYLAARVLAAVMFIRWFRRAYFNLHLKFNHLSFKETQAVWCWFIPFVNLVQPFNIMREMWNTTTEYVKEQSSNLRSIVGWWWAFYLINNIVSNVVSRVYREAEDMESIIEANMAEFYITPLDFIAAILAIIMVRKYSEYEEVIRNSEDLSSEIDEISGIQTL